jgi:hypothetical protein
MEGLTEIIEKTFPNSTHNMSVLSRKMDSCLVQGVIYIYSTDTLF